MVIKKDKIKYWKYIPKGCSATHKNIHSYSFILLKLH